MKIAAYMQMRVNALNSELQLDNNKKSNMWSWGCSNTVHLKQNVIEKLANSMQQIWQTCHIT